MIEVIKEHIEFLGLTMGGLTVTYTKIGGMITEEALEVRYRPWSKILCYVKLEDQTLILSKFERNERKEDHTMYYRELNLADPNSMNDLETAIRDFWRHSVN